MEFPQLRAWLRLTRPSPDIVLVSIYDIKFYPYSEPDEDPVFAAVAEREIYICKPVCKSKTSKTNGLEILTVLEDPDEDISLNSVAWSKDSRTGEPLVCVAGSGSNNIKILNVVTGNLARVLYGHGGTDIPEAVNDLVTSPVSPNIIASCSSDYTIRIWNLDRKYDKQPCAAILSGEGHRQTILSIDFHDNGRWLLSGGQDTMVCLWSVPEIPDENAGTDRPTAVVFPHFASINMHSDYVDCVRFLGDLVISRASTGNNIHVKRGDIMLWKIEGFSSADMNPPEAPMPGCGRPTRSAFGGTFQRLLTFDMMSVEPFYMRFGLLKKHGHRPMLVMGNIKARFSFWDLQRFEERRPAKKKLKAVVKSNKRDKDLARQVLINNAMRASSDASSLVTIASRKSELISRRMSIRSKVRASRTLPTPVSALGSTPVLTPTSITKAPVAPSEASGPPPKAPIPPNKAPIPPSKDSKPPFKYPKPQSKDPKPPSKDSKSQSKGPTPVYKRVPPKVNINTRTSKNYIRHAAHKMIVVNCPIDFACRAIDWSHDGKWCVGVGDRGMIAIFGREKTK
ncbi:WD40 repeat-like protein [Aureobasidium subglaciale]|nr:WD40 repeat-like protein [Aureobasidium subglaciale]KAI5223050.1 WD40 repeat-like protein [Aureobasidium subglaciale]KAI5226705.1 WD40 repeat-like protein [Aureobasidium subglaciale]KAI5262367.1 WD40 repeat-like protein [Aureobasidium subglaciale]